MWNTMNDFQQGLFWTEILTEIVQYYPHIETIIATQPSL